MVALFIGYFCHDSNNDHSGTMCVHGGERLGESLGLVVGGGGLALNNGRKVLSHTWLDHILNPGKSPEQAEHCY